MAGARYPLLLTVGQAAKLLGVGRSTLYDGIRSGESNVPVLRIGKQWRVPLAAVERILAGGETAGVDTSRSKAQEVESLPPASCPRCGAWPASSSRPTWSDAFRSSSPTASV